MVSDQFKWPNIKFLKSLQLQTLIFTSKQFKAPGHQNLSRARLKNTVLKVLHPRALSDAMIAKLSHYTRKCLRQRDNQSRGSLLSQFALPKLR